MRWPERAARRPCGIPNIARLAPVIALLVLLLPVSDLFARAPFQNSESVAQQGPVLGVREARVAFSPRGEALDLILRELRGARQSIDIAIFYLSHDDLIDALCYMSSERDVRVRVLTGGRMATPARMPVLKRLADHGVSVYVRQLPNNGLMHLKCAIIDGETVVAGAANWSPAAFEQNFEDTLIIPSRQLAHRYISQIDAQLAKAESVSHRYGEEPERTRFPDIEQFERSRREDRFAADRASVVRDIRAAEVYFHPGRDGMRRLLTQMRQARSRIDIAMYLLNDEEVLMTAVEIAETGHVDVRLLIDSDMLSGAYLGHMQRLWDAGVDIHYYQQNRATMHLKATIIDERYVWTGSANWTSGALELNVEDMLHFDSSDMAELYLGYMEGIREFSESFAPLALNHEVAEVETEAEYDLAGFLIGLPPTGPRTDFSNLRSPTAFPSFGVSGVAAYLPDEEYFPVLIDLIRNAHQSILITMYVMSETKTEARHQEQVVRELERAAESGVYVYVLLHTPPGVNDRLFVSHSNWAERLRAGGIDVRLSPPGLHLHDKMVVVDLAKIIIGSHNWSEGALSGERVYESSALIVLPEQEPRFAEYVFSRETVSDMRSRQLWEQEISLIRHIRSMPSAERRTFIAELEAQANP